MRIGNANRSEMQELSAVHAGAGAILFGRLWGRSDFESPFAFCHTAILPPHSPVVPSTNTRFGWKVIIDS